MKNPALIVVILVLLLGGYFAYTRFVAPAQNANLTSENMVDDEGFTGSAKAAMALGIPMKCDYTLEDGTLATGYIKAGMYAGQTTIDGVVGNILVKDNCSWTWNDDTKEGVTFCSDPEEVEAMLEAGETVPDRPTVDSDTVNVPDVDFNCSPTVIDDSMFTPPTDVTFTDFSAMMEGFIENIPDNMMEGFDPETMMPNN